MRSCLYVVAALALVPCAFVASAEASIIQMQVTGTVGNNNANQSVTTGYGSLITGDSFSMTVIFDDGAPDTNPGSVITGIFESAIQAFMFSTGNGVLVSGNGVGFPSAAVIVTNGGAFDRLRVSAGLPYLDVREGLGSLNVLNQIQFNQTGAMSVLSSDELPPALTQAASDLLSTKDLRMFFSAAVVGDPTSVTLNVSSVVMTIVPAPGSVVVAGFFGLFMSRRRR